MHTPTSLDPDATLQSGNGSSAGSHARQIGHRAAAALDEKRGTVAGGMETVASALHRGADRLPGGERVASAAHAAASAMESAADYMREQDLRGMMSDVRQVARRHPGATLLTAAAVGYLLVRALSRR